MIERERRTSGSSTGRRGLKPPRPGAGSVSAHQPVQAESVQQPVAQTPISGLPANYREVLQEIKSRVRESQASAATVVNRELIALYSTSAACSRDRPKPPGGATR